jgi:hypothetical protein
MHTETSKFNKSNFGQEKHILEGLGLKDLLSDNMTLNYDLWPYRIKSILQLA